MDKMDVISTSVMGYLGVRAFGFNLYARRTTAKIAEQQGYILSAKQEKALKLFKTLNLTPEHSLDPFVMIFRNFTVSAGQNTGVDKNTIDRNKIIQYYKSTRWIARAFTLISLGAIAWIAYYQYGEKFMNLLAPNRTSNANSHRNSN